MLENIFKGIFSSESETVISAPNFLLCIGTSLLIGIFLAAVYAYKSKYTKSFVATLAIMPAAVCTIIMMVNGNIGAGVAVAGAFSLIRFRSVAGSAREIGAIFIAMASGMIAGMGYLAYAALAAVLLGTAMFVYYKVISGKGSENKEKVLRITIPEDLNYTDVFNDIFEKYTKKYESLSVKTTNMGSLFKLTYNITLKDASQEKEMIDALRCRNGNFEISVSNREENYSEL